MSNRDSTLKALNAYSKRAIVKPKRKNKAPEKAFVKALYEHMRQKLGFSIDVVESKSVFSVAAGRYLRGQAISGFPDIVGCDRHGILVAIECKAPKKRRTLKEHQKEFLRQKIEMNAFAACIDDIETLDKLYLAWLNYRKSNQKTQAQALLLYYLNNFKLP